MKKLFITALIFIYSYGYSQDSSKVKTKAPYQKALKEVKEKSYTIYETPNGLKVRDSLSGVLLQYIYSLQGELEKYKKELVITIDSRDKYFDKVQELLNKKNR